MTAVTAINEKYRIDNLYNLPIAAGLVGIVAKNIKNKNYGVVAAGVVGLAVVAFLSFRKPR